MTLRVETSTVSPHQGFVDGYLGTRRRMAEPWGRRLRRDLIRAVAARSLDSSSKNPSGEGGAGIQSVGFCAGAHCLVCSDAANAEVVAESRVTGRHSRDYPACLAPARQWARGLSLRSIWDTWTRPAPLCAGCPRLNL